jgi:hypothetical protein
MRDKRRLARFSATLLTLAAAAAGLGYVWCHTQRGPAVALELHLPPEQTVLAPGRTYRLEGKVRNAVGWVECNGRRARPDAQGRFALALEPTGDHGLELIECVARNAGARRYFFRFGRLLGERVPLTKTVERAISARLPARLFTGQGGLLHALNRIFEGPLKAALNRAGRRLEQRIGGLRVGGMSIAQIRLVKIGADPDGAVTFTVRLEGVCLHLGLRSGSLPKVLAPLARHLERRRRLCLPLVFTVDWALRVGPARNFELKVGGLSSELVEKAAGLEVWARDPTLQTWIAAPLRETLRWVSRRAQSVLQKLNTAFTEVDRRLTQLVDLLPALPKRWGPKRPRVCFALTLRKLASDRQGGFRVEVSARISGYTLGGKKCGGGQMRGFAAEAFRVVPPGQATAERPPPFGPQPTVAVSLELINAYLAALVSLGALQNVHVEIDALKRHGFDVRRLDFALQPLVTVDSTAGLFLTVAELEAALDTLGEARRLFRIHGVVPLRAKHRQDGVWSLVLARKQWPRLGLRCVGELGGIECAAQSQRYEEIIETATELLRVGRIGLPDLNLKATLPFWSSRNLYVGADRIRLDKTYLLLTLKVKNRRLTGRQGSGNIGRP